MKDKILSGQVFMYRTGGIPSTCVSYKMKDTVDKQILQSAANAVLGRFAYFKCKAVEEQGEYYLVDNDLLFVVQDAVIPLAGEQANYYLFSICAAGNDIVFSFHHGLCDGRGISVFAQSVLYYYATSYYQRAFHAPIAQLCESAPSATEAADPFAMALDVPPEALQEPEQKPFVLPEATRQYDEHYRWRIQFDSEELFSFSHRYGTGISAVVALFMSEAIGDIFPQEESISACLATDDRTAVNLQDTLKNCISSISLPYNEKLKKMDLEAKFTVYTGKTIAQKTRQKALARLARGKILVQYLAKCPDLASKRQMMKFTDSLAVHTFLVSYLGRSDLGEVEQVIDFAEIYGSGTNGLVVEVMAINHTINVGVAQNFATERYIDSFVKVSQKYGLHPTVEALGGFSTPRCPIR